MVFLELRRHSRVTTGISAFPWGWPREAQSSPRVARERWGLRSSHCRGCRFSPWSGDKSHMLDSVAKNKTKQKKRLNKIMCKYIHTYTMYMYTYMCIIETLCCKAEINRTLESSCASLKKYHHWEKKRLVCFIVRKVYIQRKLL